jgi:dsDNA-specific endonuclease/ATPase MutS2
MDAKLTLKLNKEIIERAKQYAQDKNTSLSKLIENILSKVTDKTSFKTEITPLVDGLSGILYLDKTDEDDYRDYLEEKYK